jgi:FtsZ-interacting cell division protein ZipA
MKTMETDDLVKSQLLQKAAQQRQEIESEMHEITDRTEKVLTNALIIGGALALTYFLVRGFSSKKKRKAHKAKAKANKAKANKATEVDNVDEEVESYEESGPARILSQIGTAVASQATMILLDLAKEKLMEYLQAQAQKKADENS